MNRALFARWRGNFLTGLAIVLPVIITVGVVVWAFRNISSITDLLLIFLPRELTHEGNGNGPMYWYWSVAALLVAVVLTALLGRATRNYFGKKLIGWMDLVLLRVPLMNKIYGTIKQVNEAFSPSSKSSFQQVVMVEFPMAGQYAVGFITSSVQGEILQRSKQQLVSVFVPTTPNPTSGFLILLPETSITRLDMSVAEGIKYIISLGAITPEMHIAPPPPLKSVPVQ